MVQYITLDKTMPHIVLTSGLSEYSSVKYYAKHCPGTVVYKTVQREYLHSISEEVGKYGTPTRCNNNSFIDLQDQLNMFQASFCPSSGAQD
jgi:hypothetical protein